MTIWVWQALGIFGLCDATTVRQTSKCQMTMVQNIPITKYSLWFHACIGTNVP
jgi:hypothetical protein